MADTRTQIAAALFQPAPGGYVYREPYRWPFADAPHYLVNEEQKAQLLAVIVPRRPILWQIVLWGALCAMVALAGVAVWLHTGHDTPTPLDLFGMIVLTAVQAIVALAILFWWKRRRLAPLLASLPRTELRISRAEMRAAAAKAMSRKQLIVVTAANVFASIAMLVNSVIQFTVMHSPMGFFWLALGAVFAVLTIYYFRQLRARTGKIDEP
jgi:uncharacterized iron-regulated membrane protein